MTDSAGISLRPFGTEDRDRDGLALRDIIAVDPRAYLVAQPDRFSTLDKAALRARFHQCKPASALPEEIRRTGSVRQQRIGPGHEYQTRLVEACGGSLWPDADHIAQRARDLGAWKQRRQRRQHDAIDPCRQKRGCDH